jgi:ribosome-binding protein aMBF1 (putative translation factor)
MKGVLWDLPSAWYGGGVSKKGADKKKQDEATRLAELVERIAANTIELRRLRGWTQLKAAEQCSLDPRLYRRVERGESPASLPTIARLCNGFDVDVVRLIRPLKR